MRDTIRLAGDLFPCIYPPTSYIKMELTKVKKHCDRCHATAEEDSN